MSQAIFTSDAPRPIGPYSQAIRAEGLLFVSGQLAIDPDTGKYAPASVAEETERALSHIRAILSAAQMDFTHVVKTSIFLQQMADFPAVNEVYGRYFVSDGSVPSSCPRDCSGGRSSSRGEGRDLVYSCC